MQHKTFNIGGFVFLIAVVYCMCYLLLRNNQIPFSIHSVLTRFNHCSHWRILSVALLPIYVGLMIFGGGVLGGYLGSSFQRWAARRFKFKSFR